jgi:hypothetical protein
MMFITKKHMSRRAVIRGMGVTVALPFLESMLPAMTPAGSTEAGKPATRLACMEMVHGAAGCARYGAEKNMWSPAQVGHDFDLTPSSMLPLDPWKDHLTIVSNTDMQAADAWTLPEVGGDHFRCSAVYMTEAHPKQTEGSDVYCGISFDQVYAQKYGQDTALPSIQLSIEPVDQAGGCNYGYSCAYTDSISWESATKPLPMIRDPRMVFDQLFGAGSTPSDRSSRRQADRSILDWLTHEVARVKTNLDPLDRSRLDEHLENIREIERRIQKIEERNRSGETRELPTAPVGVPDSFEEHVKLMFDLQAVAFAGDITRVASFKLSRDSVGRTFPESGVGAGFHGASHHGDNPQRITQFAMINKYHVSMVSYFLEKLKKIQDGDATMLDRSIILYGSPMGDPNVHNHRRVPIFLGGHGNGALKGHVHVSPPDGTPTANMYLTLLHRMGINIDVFGDSTGELSL